MGAIPSMEESWRLSCLVTPETCLEHCDRGLSFHICTRNKTVRGLTQMHTFFTCFQKEHTMHFQAGLWSGSSSTQTAVHGN